ncbi:Elongation factor Ts, mitochondrial [Quaeritorhiza haematococci]|nr:Elongation factor Ts, mitochondrial [Quaeritorhiza haematococci]
MNPCRTKFCGTIFLQSSPIKANVSLIAKIRKETQCSISKAKEALIAANNDYDAALEWLEKDAAASGAKKAAKVSGRTAKEGIIAVLGGLTNNNGSGEETLVRGAGRAFMVEINSETDFVSRSDIFKEFVQGVAATGYLLGEEIVSTEGANVSGIRPVSIDTLLASPLLPTMTQAADVAGKTVQQALIETIGKLGENIQIRRAVAITPKPSPTTLFEIKQRQQGPRSFVVTGVYVHSSGGENLPRNLGRIGGVVALDVEPTPSEVNETFLKERVPLLAKQLAQQVVGFAPTSLGSYEEATSTDATSLYGQDFMLGGGTVRNVLKEMETENGVKLRIVGFERFECGEGIEKEESNFAEEVAKQVGGQ